jgi:hypothetical protein
MLDDCLSCLYVPDEQVLQLTFGASFCKLQNEATLFAPLL